MKIMERISLVLAWIACAGMISPVASFGEQNSVAATRSVQDVSTRAGTFAGQVVDHQGNPIADTVVAIGQNGSNVATAKTGPDGRFQFDAMQGGVYHVQAAGRTSVCRVWSENSAPPAATDGLLVVADSDVVRGQCNTCNSAPMMSGGYPAQGGYVEGGYMDGGCAPPCETGCCPPQRGCGGVLGWISNPWFVGAAVAAAIAIPLAVDDDDDDNAS